MQNNQSIVQESDEVKRDNLVKVLKLEFSTMKKKVTLDNYFATLAELLCWKARPFKRDREGDH